MPDNACVYSPTPSLPWEVVAADLAPGAAVSVGESIVVEWPELRLVIHPMPREELGAHLLGFKDYIRSEGGRASEALATRALSSLGVFGIEIEPSFEDQRAVDFVFGLTSGTGGLCFIGGEVYDGRGRPLLLEGSLERPGASQVAARAICLLACAFRGLLEQDAGKPDEAQAEALSRELMSFVDAIPRVKAELEPPERALLESAVGDLPLQEAINAVWGAEGACVLLWALGVRPLAPHDHSEHPFEVCREIGLYPGEDPPSLLNSPQLRPDEEIDAQRDLLRGLHWRLTDYLSVEQKAMDFAAFAKSTNLGTFDLSETPLAEGDLAIQGQPISATPPELIGHTRSIAVERHRAANWLVGTNSVYAYVETPT